MTRFVVVRFTFEGIHHWPDAPNRAAFLREGHRHVFHVEAHKKVTHANRDVEFITLKRDMLSFLGNAYERLDGCHMLGEMSCEMVAADLARAFGLMQCTVYEDGENGGGVIVEESDG